MVVGAMIKSLVLSWEYFKKEDGFSLMVVVG